MTEDFDKGWIAGYKKGYMTGLEFVSKYCQDMIESHLKEYLKK